MPSGQAMTEHLAGRRLGRLRFGVSDAGQKVVKNGHSLTMR